MYTYIVHRFKGKVTEYLICDKFYQTKKNISHLLKPVTRNSGKRLFDPCSELMRVIIILLITRRRILRYREVKQPVQDHLMIKWLSEGSNPD